MCNLYAMVRGQKEIVAATGATIDRTGDLEPLPGVFPNTWAPIVRNEGGQRILAKARWGMPSPAKVLEGRKVDPGVTNVRNTKSSHWRRWLGVEHRRVVPLTSFSEPEPLPDGSKPPIWFALDEARPLAFFAGIRTPAWTSTRRVKDGETTDDLYAFLTCHPNALVEQFHPKAMPVILTSRDEIEHWLTASSAEALKLQRPLPENALQIVARGAKRDQDSDEAKT